MKQNCQVFSVEHPEQLHHGQLECSIVKLLDKQVLSLQMRIGLTLMRLCADTPNTKGWGKKSLTGLGLDRFAFDVQYKAEALSFREFAKTHIGCKQAIRKLNCYKESSGFNESLGILFD